jgi:hypothetical protein
MTGEKEYFGKKILDRILIRKFRGYADPNNDGVVNQRELNSLNRYILDPHNTGEITPANAKKAIESFISIRQELNGEAIITSDLFMNRKSAEDAITSLLKRGVINGNEPLFKHVSPEAVGVAVDTFYKGLPFTYNNKRPLTQNPGR